MGFDIADFPNAYHLFENEITFPLNTKMSLDDAGYVIDNFVEIVKTYSYVIKPPGNRGLFCVGGV